MSTPVTPIRVLPVIPIRVLTRDPDPGSYRDPDPGLPVIQVRENGTGGGWCEACRVIAAEDGHSLRLNAPWPAGHLPRGGRSAASAPRSFQPHWRLAKAGVTSNLPP